MENQGKWKENAWFLFLIFLKVFKYSGSFNKE